MAGQEALIGAHLDLSAVDSKTENDGRINELPHKVSEITDSKQKTFDISILSQYTTNQSDAMTAALSLDTITDRLESLRPYPPSSHFSKHSCYHEITELNNADTGNSDISRKPHLQLRKPNVPPKTNSHEFSKIQSDARTTKPYAKWNINFQELTIYHLSAQSIPTAQSCMCGKDLQLGPSVLVLQELTFKELREQSLPLVKMDMSINLRDMRSAIRFHSSLVEDQTGYHYQLPETDVHLLPQIETDALPEADISHPLLEIDMKPLASSVKKSLRQSKIRMYRIKRMGFRKSYRSMHKTKQLVKHSKRAVHKRFKICNDCVRPGEPGRGASHIVKRVRTTSVALSHKIQSKLLCPNKDETAEGHSVLEESNQLEDDLKPEGKTKSEDNPIGPQEETQYGSHSSRVFANDSAFMKLMKVCVQEGKNPVIGLLSSDFFTKHHFSRQKSATRHLMTTSPESCGVEDQIRGGPIIGVGTESPFNANEITQLLHASDYPKIIQLLGNIPESMIPSLFIAGVAYFKMSKFEEAEFYFYKAKTAAIEANRDGDVMLCSAYLGDIEYASQSYLRAAEYYKESIEHYTSRSVHVAIIFKLTAPTLSAIYAKRASSFRNASKMLEAVQGYTTAIDVAQQDRDKLSAHTSLGNLYQSMGENNSALKEYKQSIEIAEKLSDHVSLGWAHGNIGNAYLGLSKKDEAVNHLQKSLELAVEYEQTPQAIGRTYNNLGTAYQSMNDLDKAEEYYDLALSQAIYGNDIPGQARVYGNIGNVHMLRKNYEKAIPHYSEVLRLSSDPSTVSTARHNRGCAYYEWATSLHFSNASKFQQSSLHGPDCDGDSCLNHVPAKAKELYRKGSDDLEEVVKYHEERFQHIKGSLRGLTLSVSLLESNSRTFHRLQDCLVNLHKWEQALVVAEQSRARTLGELMLKKKGNQCLTSPLSFDQIASIVKSQCCPVVYLSYTGARLISWVFIPHSGEVSMNMFEVPLADDQFEGKSFDYHLRYSLTEKLVERSFEMYQAISYDEDSSSPVQLLHELVAAPISKLLNKYGDSSPPTQQVIFISDSYTSLLPLTCLLDAKTKSFFGDRHYFKLAPSLLALGIMGHLLEVKVTLQTDKHDFCVIGDPNIPPFYLNGEVWALGKLPHARQEAEWVAHALQTTPILNDNATKTALLNRAMSAKVIHIATHGSASAGFLAFAVFSIRSQSEIGNYAPAGNVLLYPEDVERLNISPALVVLSSCDSGRGTVKADGIQGMARAFILAGAQSVLTTLWKVPDESASVFMQFFYQYLLDGLKCSSALQKAILSMRCFTKFSQYIHWGGYQLIGHDVQFLYKPTISSLKNGLGEPSIFPRVTDVKKLEKALVSNPCVPTDVQVFFSVYAC